MRRCIHINDITIIQRRHKSGSNKNLFTLKGKTRLNSGVKTPFDLEHFYQLLNMRHGGENHQFKSQEAYTETQKKNWLFGPMILDWTLTQNWKKSNSFSVFQSHQKRYRLCRAIPFFPWHVKTLSLILHFLILGHVKDQMIYFYFKLNVLTHKRGCFFLLIWLYHSSHLPLVAARTSDVLPFHMKEFWLWRRN